MKTLITLVVLTIPAISFADVSSTSTNSGIHNNYVSTSASATMQPTDAAITTNVESAFLKHKLFGNAGVSAFTIKVVTNDGIVHLSGFADNQLQADTAAKVAKDIDGVKNVVSDVQIKSAN